MAKPKTYATENTALRAAKGADVPDGSVKLVQDEDGRWLWYDARLEARTAECEEGPEPKAAPDGQKALKPGSKAHAIIEMLRRPEGATMNELRDFTGWKTVHGFLSRDVPLYGLAVSKEKVEGRGNVYTVNPA